MQPEQAPPSWTPQLPEPGGYSDAPTAQPPGYPTPAPQAGGYPTPAPQPGGYPGYSETPGAQTGGYPGYADTPATQPSGYSGYSEIPAPQPGGYPGHAEAPALQSSWTNTPAAQPGAYPGYAGVAVPQPGGYPGHAEAPAPPPGYSAPTAQYDTYPAAQPGPSYPGATMPMPPSGYSEGAVSGYPAAGQPDHAAGGPGQPPPWDPDAMPPWLVQPGSLPVGPVRSARSGLRKGLIIGAVALVALVGVGTFGVNSYAKRTICSSLKSDDAFSSGSGSDSAKSSPAAGPTDAELADLRKGADEMRNYGRMLVLDGDLKSAVNGLADDMVQMTDVFTKAKKAPTPKLFTQLVTVAGSVNSHVRQAQKACGLPVTGVFDE